MIPGDGGVYNSDPVVSGGGSTSKSVPRVIVTGFATDPGAVNAGSNFRLTVHVKNTSSTTAVSNMLFDLQAPAAGTEGAAEAPGVSFRRPVPARFIWTVSRQGRREILPSI